VFTSILNTLVCYNDPSNLPATVGAAGGPVIFKDVNLARKRPRTPEKTVLAKFSIFSSNFDNFKRQEKDNEASDKIPRH
jgi:hypothetical protein